MIQFKRGKSSTWQNSTEILADGQPGYDKEWKKLKIGDGVTSWKGLPFISGLFRDEIFDEEKEAKKKVKARNILNGLGLKSLENRTIFTYGPEMPDENTVGQVYLQHYTTEPETDYIISQGKNGIWVYQIWHSGIARCWGTLPITTTVKDILDKGLLYCNDTDMEAMSYPIPFSETPCETATLQSPSSTLAWLANYNSNSKDKTGKYRIISSSSHENKTYNIILDVKGYINKEIWLK